MRKLFILLSLISTLVLTGCISVKQDGITIKGAKDITIGDTLKLSLDIVNKENNEISGVKWSSSNADVLSISTSGEVAAISIGTSKISASMSIGDEEYTSNVDISVTRTVSGSVDGVNIINVETITYLGVGEVIHVDYQVVNKKNASITDVVWSSSTSKISVDQSGKVEAISTGAATLSITLKIGGKEYKDSRSFFVNETTTDLVSVKITNGKSLYKDETVQLGVEYNNPDDLLVSNKQWSVDNDNITITEDGLVTAIKYGTTYVTFSARIGNKTYSNTIMVVVIDNSSAGDADNIYLNKGELVTSDPKVNEKVEMSFKEVNEGFIESNYNPYDYEEIKVEATIIDSQSTFLKMPLFWGYDSTINLNTSSKNPSGNNGVASTSKDEIQGEEKFYYESNGEYFLRFNPKNAGTHTIMTNVFIDGVKKATITQTINVVENEGDSRGIIEVDTTNNRSLIDENGNTFIANGMNHAWYTSSTRASYDFQVWFEQSSNVGINTTRIWLADWGMTVRTNNSYDNFTKSVGAERFDHILQQAEENDIYIQLTLNHHGQFTEYTNTVWKNNAYNKINGGMLDKPYEFFSNEEAKAAYKNELMYIIARYGYSDNILAWELFNEVDYTYHVDYSNMIPEIGAQLAVDVKDWHEEMGAFIKANDPYKHMITTSYKASTGPAFNLDVIDYTNIHNYGFYETSGFWKGDVQSLLDQIPKEAQSTSKTYEKPVFHSEVGVNYENGTLTALEDPEAINIHQSLYAGFLGGGIGGGMQWWWDSWIHPKNLYSKYDGATQFANMLDLTGGDYSAVTHNSSTVTSSNGDLHMFGYLFNERSYGYVYDANFNHWSTNTRNLTETLTLTINSGNYEVQYFNPLTNELLTTQNVTSTNNQLVLNIPTFNNEVTYILTKK